MKIAILVAGLPPIYNGGTEIATSQLAKYAVKMGHEVHVMALDGTKQGGHYYKSNEYFVHRVKTISVPYLYGVVGLFGILKSIIKVKPDIIHAQGSQMGLLALVAKWITKIPFILYGRGEIYVDWFMKNYITKLLMKNAKRIIAQTEHMRNLFYKYTNRNVEVIPNGIILNRPCFCLCPRIDKQKTSIVLSVGQLRPEKNVRCLIEAWKYISNGNGLSLIIIGGGPQFDELKEMAKKYHNIYFKGNMSNDMVRSYMANSTILVNTSLSEGFPVTLLEGMSFGLPIVAPQVCGIPEIIENGKNGILTIPNDSSSTALAINTLLKDKGLYQYMSMNNKEKVKRYTWDKVVERLYN